MTHYDVFAERITQLPNYNPHAKRPSRSRSESFSVPNTPTPSSIAEALLNSAVEDEQKKTDSNNGNGIHKQTLSGSNLHSNKQAAMSPLQKSSSMSCATRPGPKT